MLGRRGSSQRASTCMPLDETLGFSGDCPREPLLLAAPCPILRRSLREARGDKAILGVTLPPASLPTSSKLQEEAEGPMDSMASCWAWAAKFWADLS